jgi:hypothetical protein
MLEHFKDVPYGMEIWVKNRWSDVKAHEGASQHAGEPGA